MAVAFGKKAGIGALGDRLCEGVQGGCIGGLTPFIAHFTSIDGPVNRDGIEGSKETTQNRELKQAVPGTEYDGSRELSDNQTRIDQAVGMPGDQYAASFFGDVFQSGDLDPPKEAPHQKGKES